MTMQEAKQLLAHKGVTLTRRSAWEEFRVNLMSVGTEATAYYTSDLQDAYDTGVAMANHYDLMHKRA